MELHKTVQGCLQQQETGPNEPRGPFQAFNQSGHLQVTDLKGEPSSSSLLKDASNQTGQTIKK